MAIDNDDRSESNNGLSPRYDADSTDDNERREPTFGGFDEKDEVEYEEPDRDTDYSSGYGAEDVAEEEEIEGSFPDEGALSLPESELSSTFLSSVRSEPDHSVTEESDDWLEEEEYVEEDDNDEPSWPLRLIAVGAVALILLAAGVYGVMQERSATQETLRELRATLATTANPEGVRTSREALREMQLSYDTLAAEAETLSTENQILTEVVAGLEAQLSDQNDRLKEQAPPPTAKQPIPVSGRKTTSPPPSPQPSFAAKPVASTTTATQPATPVSSDPWFVNFGSYSARTMAETWAARLHPITGKVIVATSAQGDKTYYRVRVVGLANKDSANEVARKLEADLQVSQLWVGRN